MIKNQEMFDKVATHLFTQEVQAKLVASDGSQSCLYRGPNNTTCAIGCMIPNEMYDRDMEDDSVAGVIESHPEVEGVIGDVFLQVIFRLFMTMITTGSARRL